jgi:hypothetical protein
MPLALGEKLSFFTPDSDYHGGPGEGHGKRNFTSGQKFDGYWKDDEQEGHGKLVTKEGTAYDGDWKGGAMHGQGSYTYQHLRGDRSSNYEGQWSEGQYEGRGKLTLYSGNIYDGEWRANKRNGWGLYTIAAPTVAGLAAYEGEWVDDARTGKGTSKGADGHLEINRYENGQRVGEGVRLLDESLLKPDEPRGPFKLLDGREVKEITVEEAQKIATSVGLKGPLPSFPWPPSA